MDLVTHDVPSMPLIAVASTGVNLTKDVQMSEEAKSNPPSEGLWRAFLQKSQYKETMPFQTCIRDPSYNVPAEDKPSEAHERVLPTTHQQISYLQEACNSAGDLKSPEIKTSLHPNNHRVLPGLNEPGK